jgi:hypothetical protein
MTGYHREQPGPLVIGVLEEKKGNVREGKLRTWGEETWRRERFYTEPGGPIGKKTSVLST